MKSIYYILWCILCLALCSGVLNTAMAQQDDATTSSVVLITRLDNEIINPVTAEYILSSIERAEKSNALCLILRLDTPGGLLESTRDIVKRILNSRVPVVVYVSPSGARAASAGVFITLSSHIAAMAPSTNIGAAHPVNIGGQPMQPSPEQTPQATPVKKATPAPEMPGEQQKEQGEKEPAESEQEPTSQDVMSEKIINDTTAWIRALAEYRGRNADWAEQAVRKSVSLTETEALEKNVIDLVASSEEDLVAKINGRTVKVEGKTLTLNTSGAVLEYVSMSKRQELLNIIANPNIAYLLLMLGFYGLLFEITHPGAIFPGVAGAFCLILAASSLQMLPINYAGLILIIMGLGMLIAEVMVTSYGLLTIGGLLGLVLGSVMLVRAPQPFIGVSLTFIIPIVAATALVVLFLVSLVVKSHSRQTTTGREGLVGKKGVVEIPLSPQGKVFLHGELWDAYSDEPLEKGTTIRVVNVEGMIVKVEPLGGEETAL